MNLKQQIKEAVRFKLTEGESLRIICPACGGGSTKEKSMAVTHTYRGIAFVCFRANCNARGWLDGGVTLAKEKKKKIQTYNPDLITIPEESLVHLPVQETSTPIFFDKKTQTVLYPVMSIDGQHLGYVQRMYRAFNDWWTGPKAVNRPFSEHDDKDFIHFPVGTGDRLEDTIIAVEDWPSAEAINKYHPAMAILGTELTADIAVHLREIGINNLVICLDADAQAKAIKLKRRVSLFFNSVEVRFVTKDPKDMSEAELQEMIYV